MNKMILMLGAIASMPASNLQAVTAGTAHVDDIDGTVQFFNDNVREFSSSSNSASHQQNALVIADGNVYVTFYNADGSLMVARRDENNNNDSWTRIDLGLDQTDPDSHRTSNIAVSPVDKRLHIMWGHHADRLNYIVSKDSNTTLVSDSQFTASLFESNRNHLATGQNLTRVCYPRMFVGANNTLQVVWRDDGGSGNADSFISTYNNNKTWTSRLRIINGKTGAYTDPDSTNNGTSTNANRNAYFNDIGYRNGKTHVSWTWRENSQNENGFVTNHDLQYAYSTNGGNNWYNRFDNQIANTGSLTMNLNSADITFRDLPYAKKVDNQCGQAIDRTGRVHMIWRHTNASGSKVLHHYFKSEGSTNVNTRERSNLTSSIRPKIYADPTDNTKDTLYIVTIAGTKLRVYGANKGSDFWGTWSTLYTSSDDYVTATAQIANDGRKLFILAQKRPSAPATATSSGLDLITLPVTP